MRGAKGGARRSNRDVSLYQIRVLAAGEVLLGAVAAYHRHCQYRGGRTGLPALKPNEFFLFSNDRRSRAFVDEWTSSRQTSSITWSFPQCRRCTTGRSGSSFACRHRRLLADSVEKSTMVCAAEKYASEIEIFTFGRGFRARISRSSVQKRRLHQSKIREFGQTDCFQQNRPEAATPV